MKTLRACLAILETFALLMLQGEVSNLQGIVSHVHRFPSSEGWPIFEEYTFLLWVVHVLLLCPFSLHNLHLYVLRLPELGIPFFRPILNFSPITLGHVVRLWPLWSQILQRWGLLTVLLGLINIGHVLLLWPFSPHAPQMNCLFIKLAFSSGQ